MCCGYQRKERCSWQRNAPTARATSANAQTGVGRVAIPQAKPPQNWQLHPRGVHPAGCRGAAEAGTRQTPRQSVDVPIRQNRRNVPPRLGGNAPQADPQGRGTGAYQVPRPETYIRDLGTAKRRRCKNSVFNARSLRRRIHSPHLHPRHTTDAAKGRGENGQLHGADSISPAGKQSTGKEAISLRCSLVLSAHFVVPMGHELAVGGKAADCPYGSNACPPNGAVGQNLVSIFLGTV